MRENEILPDACFRLFIHEINDAIRRNVASRQQELANLSHAAHCGNVGGCSFRVR
jgi:hypothetical protein